MSSRPQRPLPFCARGLRPTTLFATPACVAEIWSRCRASVALGILVFSLRGTWDSVLSQSGADATRKGWRTIWGHTFTSIVPPTVPQRMGGARAILATGTSGDAMGSLVAGLAARGQLIVAGVPQDQIHLDAFPLVFGGRAIYGSLTGTPIDGEDTLAFSVLENIR